MNHFISVVTSSLALLCSFTACGQEPPNPVRGQLRLKGSPSAMEFACTPLKENAINCKFIELDVWQVRTDSHDATPKSKQTCIFNAHPFDQTLQLTRRGSGGEIEWATDSGPSGACQVLRRARFIGREIDHGIDWEYLVEVKVLQKSEESGQLRCSDIKEVEARYMWQGGMDARADCSSVRFSASCFSPDFSCLQNGPPVSNN